MRNDPEAFERNKTSRSWTMWARVSIRDSRANKDVEGWIPYNNIRLHGQMHDSANYWLWTPLNWINNKLGDGFLAGIVNVILLFILIPSAAFILTRFISIKMRFLHNLFLFVILILFSIVLYYHLFHSFFDPSAFNWKNWHNDTARYLYIGIIVLMGFFILRTQIRFIEESRCPDCKYWYGYVYNSELLSWSKRKFKLTSRNEYADGTSVVTGERYETHTDEDWEDSCACSRCGYRWTLSRHEHKKE